MTMAGAWALTGVAMFSLLEKASGRWVGRAGPGPGSPRAGRGPRLAEAYTRTPGTGATRRKRPRPRARAGTPCARSMAVRSRAKWRQVPTRRRSIGRAWASGRPSRARRRSSSAAAGRTWDSARRSSDSAMPPAAAQCWRSKRPRTARARAATSPRGRAVSRGVCRPPSLIAAGRAWKSRRPVAVVSGRRPVAAGRPSRESIRRGAISNLPCSGRADVPLELVERPGPAVAVAAVARGLVEELLVGERERTVPLAPSPWSRTVTSDSRSGMVRHRQVNTKRSPGTASR